MNCLIWISLLSISKPGQTLYFLLMVYEIIILIFLPLFVFEVWDWLYFHLGNCFVPHSSAIDFRHLDISLGLFKLCVLFMPMSFIPTVKLFVNM